MNNILQNIVSLFSQVQINIFDIQENYSEVIIKVSCPNGKIPSEDDFKKLLLEINSRDSIHISILEGQEIVDVFNSAHEGDFDSFINECKECLQNSPFDLRITIVKNNIKQIISVYYPDNFIKYLSDLSVIYFLEVITNSLNGNDYIIYEVQDESFISFSTNRIKFVAQGIQPTINKIDRDNLDKIKNLCHSDIISQFKFIPDDFYPLGNNIILNELFQRVTLFYCAIFLFDILNVNNNKLNYRLNGYRTISQDISISDINLSSYEIYYQIYTWVYEGGNIVDKIGLTRNILSLNFKQETLEIAGSTFDAIKSNYKIYQKENIKQYIEIRNKISEQLVNLQEKAEKIVESYVADYKRSFLAVVSFYISVIIIRVISKGDFTGGFTLEVSLLSIGFLLIFLLVMCYSRWEIKQQLERYEAIYQNMKTRYSDLLEESDIKRILNNDEDYDSNLEYIKKKERKYTELWIISLVVLLLITIVLFIVNNPKSIFSPINNITIKLIVLIKPILHAI
ncbi:hypothetical protein [Paludibacter sp.]|uniref:hypothetical protein n=1 Tax=Paludibacter sp. TaxID=1898105 RepID=UPI0013544AB8|nr:hypothetical protein [Paludibacter sp.]MTK53452.1 hypothetical protein [Paludibacter sp.]